MAGGLVALFDDIAALARMAAASVDDVAAGAMKASAKAAGVVVDDTAVTPQYLEGVTPRRELPIIKRITIGSLRNKLIFILPAALLLSQFAPWALTPLLMLGGTYLCFEGAEKVWEALRGEKAHKAEPKLRQGEGAEQQIVSSAVRTDFILSSEIMVISLNEVADETLWVRAGILIVVAIVITLGVYGVVALIVKMDDIGLHLTRRDSAFTQKFGRGLVAAMPRVMDAIAFIGTLAMIWVGGHIILHGIHEFGFDPIHNAIAAMAGAVENVAGVGGMVAWLADTLVSLAFGLAFGLLVLAIIHPLIHRLKHTDCDA